MIYMKDQIIHGVAVYPTMLIDRSAHTVVMMFQLGNHRQHPARVHGQLLLLVGIFRSKIKKHGNNE